MRRLKNSFAAGYDEVTKQNWELFIAATNLTPNTKHLISIASADNRLRLDKLLASLPRFFFFIFFLVHTHFGSLWCGKREMLSRKRCCRRIKAIFGKKIGKVSRTLACVLLPLTHVCQGVCDRITSLNHLCD